MIGIGGTGMSAIAEVLVASGFVVSGSDVQESVVTRRLQALGIAVQAGHAPSLVCKANLVVYSSAVKPENPERLYAQQHGIHAMRRAEMLGELMRTGFALCVAGTHGKTTTTALAGQVFAQAGRRPTVLVGGTLRQHGTNSVMGGGSLFIAEADEFDRSFLSMCPSLAIITNIDADHLDCYGTLDNIKDAFVTFAGLVPFYGGVIACVDDAGVRSILSRINRTVITYGVSEGVQADYRAVDVRLTPAGSCFSLMRGTTRCGQVNLTIPGLHNVSNCVAVMAAALEMDVSFGDTAAGCAAFRGVQRRFEVVGTRKGITVIDDYAHHPTEMRASIAAARASGYRRVVAVFQPHLYSRTRDLADQFADALLAADIAVVTEIYKSREEPIAGVTGEMIASRSRKLGHRNASFVASKASIAQTLRGTLRDGDAVLVMGAGDINEECQPIIEAIDNA
jgi:UDP-N-acetylmuramate--alanine ligase